MPGVHLMLAVTAVFIVVAAFGRINRQVQWDGATATVIVPADVMLGWPDARVDVNTAGKAELCVLPGIGPARAQAIVENRTRFGPFASLQDLDRVDGIGRKTVEWFDEYVVIAVPSP